MKGIRHAGIVVSDLKKSLDFYQKLLGLRVIKKMNESGSYLNQVLNLKGVKVTTVKLAAEEGNLLELLYFKSPAAEPALPTSPSRIGCSHVAFTTADLQADFKRLKDAGVKFTAPPQLSPDGKVLLAFCQDPDGTLLELVEIIK